jgi:hypothetical protein
LFKISRLITIPNPGTSVFPAGTCGCDVVGVVPLDVVGGGADVSWVVVVAVGAGEAGVSDCTSCNGGGSGAGAGGIGSWVAGALIGLTGFNGLLMFVTLVGLLTHEFIVSTQGETTG